MCASDSSRHIVNCIYHILLLSGLKGMQQCRVFKYVENEC